MGIAGSEHATGRAMTVSARSSGSGGAHDGVGCIIIFNHLKLRSRGYQSIAELALGGAVVPGTGITRNTSIWRQLHVTAGQLHVAAQAQGASY